MTDPNDWDPTGEIPSELRAAVDTYGERVLSNRQLLENFLSDQFPKSHKGASLIVTGAELDLAHSLRRHLQDGLDVTNAVALVARELEDARPVSAGSGQWVATQLARAMGLPVSGGALPGPRRDVVDGDAPTVNEPTDGGGGGGGGGDGRGGGGSGGDGGGRGDGRGGGGTMGVDEGGGDGSSGRDRGRNRQLVFAGVGVIAVYIAAAAAFKLPPLSSSPSPTTTTTTATTATTNQTGTTTTQPPSPTTTGQGVTLAALMPDQSSSNPLYPSTDCQAVSPLPSGLTGVASSLGCSVPGQSGWSLFGYQFDNTSDYDSSVTAYLNDKNFDAGSADSQCPPTGTYTAGQTGWNNGSYPSASGQNIQCMLTSQSGNNPDQPTYIYEVPSRDTIFEIVASSSATFTDLQNFWVSNGAPGA